MITITTIGRVTRDLELKTSQNGNSYVSFNLAVNKGFGESAHAVFLQCWVYGAEVDRLTKAKVAKGSLLQITGDLDVVDFQKQDGTKGTAVKVVVSNWEYGPTSKGKSDAPAGAPAYSSPTGHTMGEFEELGCDDDLPL